jgi:hypothetical protein
MGNFLTAALGTPSQHYSIGDMERIKAEQSCLYDFFLAFE